MLYEKIGELFPVALGANVIEIDIILCNKKNEIVTRSRFLTKLLGICYICYSSILRLR